MKRKQFLVLCMIAMLGVSLTACGDKTENKLVEEEQTKEELIQFEGTWFNEDSSGYDSVSFDKEGNWKLYSSGEVYNSGTMEYVQKDDCYYMYSEQDGAELNCYLNEDGKITIDAYGTFVIGAGEEQNIKQAALTDFGYYYDMWYKDASMEETSLLLEASGTWEVYDAMGVAGQGTIQIDSETYGALILMDESGEKTAHVQIDDADVMTIEVYNEELMKLPQTCMLYRESECR